jgi:hypothetical protein
MRRTEIMTAGGVTLAGLGVLAGLAIGSGEGNPATVASRTQPIEVRTEVIRKTVHVYRREHPHRVAGGGGSFPGSHGSHGSGVGVAASGMARTRASGAAVAGRTAVGSAPATVRTHSSGSSSPVRSSAPASHPVRTASSGANHPSSGSVAPVKTRSSGHGDGGDGGGGHDN